MLLVVVASQMLASDMLTADWHACGADPDHNACGWQLPGHVGAALLDGGAAVLDVVVDLRASWTSPSRFNMPSNYYAAAIKHAALDRAFAPLHDLPPLEHRRHCCCSCQAAA